MTKVTKEAAKFFAALPVAYYNSSKQSMVFENESAVYTVDDSLLANVKLNPQSVKSIPEGSKFFYGNSKRTMSQVKGYVSNLKGKFTKILSKADYTIISSEAKVGFKYKYKITAQDTSTRKDVAIYVLDDDLYNAQNTLQSNYSTKYLYSDWDVCRTTVYRGDYLNFLYELATSNTTTIIECTELERACDSKIDITEEILNNLIRMFKGNDDDKLVANETALNINFDADPYLFYKLTQTIGYWYWNLRSPRIRMFLEETNYGDIINHKPLDHILYLKRRDKLDCQTFYHLEKEVRKQVYVRNGELYNHTLTVKDEYKQYLIDYAKKLKNEKSNVI